MMEREPPECTMGRMAPEDCHAGCDYYSPGLTEQERMRVTQWNLILEYHAEQRK